MVSVDWPIYLLEPAYVQGNLESPVTRSIYKLAPFPFTRAFRLFEWQQPRRIFAFLELLAGNLCNADCSNTFTSSTFQHARREQDNIDKPDRKESGLLLGSIETGRAGGNLEKDRPWLSTDHSKFWRGSVVRYFPSCSIFTLLRPRACRELASSGVPPVSKWTIGWRISDLSQWAWPLVFVTSYWQSLFKK